MTINWKLVKKNTLVILPGIENQVSAWLKDHDGWEVDVNFVDFPPRISIIAYRLSKTDGRRMETNTYSVKRQTTIFIVQRLKDDELDDLTDLITPIVQDFNLQSASKKVKYGEVTYILWLKKDQEKVPA